MRLLAATAVAPTLARAHPASGTVHDLQRDFPTAPEDTVVLAAKDVHVQVVTTYERIERRRA